MLRLDLHREPVWLDLATGVRLCLAPLTTALMVSARNDPAVQAMQDDAPDEDRALAYAKAIARRALLGWEGVGDADGEPLDPTFAGIDALLDLYPVFEAFQLRYVNKGLLLDAEKKRLAALAEWHFGGGAGYCDACPSPCPDCPGRLNLPRTVEGWQVWDLATRMGGQLRVVPGGVVGWDFTSALMMADALGMSTLVAAEILPALEAAAVTAINRQIGSAHG